MNLCNAIAVTKAPRNGRDAWMHKKEMKCVVWFNCAPATSGSTIMIMR